jgi:hypothetical protein
MGQFQDGSHPDEQCLRAVDEAWAVCQGVDSLHHMHNIGLTGDTHMLSFQLKGPKGPIIQPPRLAQNLLGYMITQRAQ